MSESSLSTTSSTHGCSVCGNAKARLHCGVCGVLICKSCINAPVEVAGDYGNFTLMEKIPAEFLEPAFCHRCFDETVSPAHQQYLEILSRAENIIVFEKDQKKESRLLRRDQKPLRVLACADRQETLMRLAYMAAEAGFNGLIDVDLNGKKVREGSYQTTVWSGSGIPTQIDERRIPRDRSIWHNPN